MDNTNRSFLLKYTAGRKAPLAHLAYRCHFVLSDNPAAAEALFFKRIIIGGEPVAQAKSLDAHPAFCSGTSTGLVTAELLNDSRYSLGVYTHLGFVRFPSRVFHRVTMISANLDAMLDRIPLKDEVVLLPFKQTARIAAHFPFLSPRFAFD